MYKINIYWSEQKHPAHQKSEALVNSLFKHDSFYTENKNKKITKYLLFKC